MNREHYDFLVIGGGLTGAHAVSSLRNVDPGSKIGLIAEEEFLPYNRPPLSKGFLQGAVDRDSLTVFNDDYYRDNHIGLYLGMRATGVNPQEHVVAVGGGAELSYKKLLIASGCKLRRLRVPGADLSGLYYLRTLPEAEALRVAARKSSHAVVIGGGFIGLEAASVLATMGLSTTIIHRRDHLMEKFDHPEISSFFESYFVNRGINVIYEDEASEIRGKEWVEAVATKSGRTIACDMVLAGIGVVPDTDYLEGSSIELDNGVVTDEYLMTSDPDIFAAGDIANYQDRVYGRRRRVEHWDNAIRQGNAVARNMVGGREPYVRTSYFYSTVFNITYEFYGDMRGYERKIVRGSIDENSVAVFYSKDDTVQAAFMMNRSVSERRLISSLIAEQRKLVSGLQNLEDERIPLEVVLAL